MSEIEGMETDLSEVRREKKDGRRRMGQTCFLALCFCIAVTTSPFFLAPSSLASPPSFPPPFPPLSPSLSPCSPPPFPPPIPCDSERAVCLGHVTLGRTGNHLLQLAIALHEAARKRACFLFLPKRMQEDVGGDGSSKQVILEFDESGRKEDAFKYVVHMEEGVRANASHTERLVERECKWTPFANRLGWSEEMLAKVGDVRRLFQSAFRTDRMDGRYLKCGAGTIRSLVEDPRLGEDGVVMHMRGGDIMHVRGRRMDGFLQPPCAFYEQVMLRGRGGLPFRYALIVTEPEKKNPCVEHIASAFPEKVRVQSSDPTYE